MVRNAFKNRIFPLQPTEGTGNPGMLACVARAAEVFDTSTVKILAPKQMLQRLPKALAQVKAANTSKKLLNKIGEMM